MVYKQLQERPGQDTITLSILTCGMKKTAYYNGLRELLEKEFLFRVHMTVHFSSTFGSCSMAITLHS
jgi:hypothetical protein